MARASRFPPAPSSEQVVEIEGLGDPTSDRGADAVVTPLVTPRVDPRDYGLTWNVALEAGGFLVGDRIRVQLEVQATRA